MIQEAYDHDGNSFATPKFYNNLEQTGGYDMDQYFVNQAVFPGTGLHGYPNCAYNT